MREVEGVRCVVLDIEGTVCEISFVREVLFPYALKALPTVLATKWNDSDFLPYKRDFPEDAQESPEAFQSHVEDLTKRDVKIAYLKNLQGYLWQTGYETGAYATPLFPDVLGRLKAWKEEGVELAIYSSGSVFAQKLLFGHVKKGGGVAGRKRGREEGEAEEPPLKKVLTAKNGSVAKRSEDVATKEAEIKDFADHENGDHDDEPDSNIEDLQHLIKDWFDTTNAGPKTESSSYIKIAKALEIGPSEILFLSDNVKEVDAAVEAGMVSFLVDRVGNAPVSQEDRDRLVVVTSLDEVELKAGEKNGVKEAKSSTQDVAAGK